MALDSLLGILLTVPILICGHTHAAVLAAFCQTYWYQNWTVVAALYDMTNWRELCHKIILSSTNTQPAKNNKDQLQ